MPRGSSDTIRARLEALAVPPALTQVLAPLRAVLTDVQRTLDEVENRVEPIALASDVVQRLMSAPGVGPIVALTYTAVLDTPTRFGDDARRASAIRVLAAPESRREERTTSLSHLILRHALTGVSTSANRRLTEFATSATRTNDVTVRRATQHGAVSRAASAGPLAGEGPAPAARSHDLLRLPGIRACGALTRMA